MISAVESVMISTVEEAVTALGGNAAAASLIGVTSAAISNWKERGAIPANKFLVIEAALNGRRIDPAIFGFVASDGP